ncbi:conserved exported hypothetical protein [metagenome]
MKKGLVIGITGISIFIVIVAIVLVSTSKSNLTEINEITDKTSKLEKEEIQVENTLDNLKDIETNNSEIQKKYDELEKINLENEYSQKQREWITSGPFQIDRSKYAIGEKIFLVLGGLGPDEKGQIAVMRPLNATHYSVYLTIPFDGATKSAFNYYLEPQISKTRGICSVDDLTGKWTMVFRGTNYPNLNFEITKEVVPGTNIEPVC